MILEARDLRKRYGSVLAVDGVSLDVAAGEVVGLLGPNGAGKTTTFRLLCGLARADGGEVRLGGVEMTGWPLARRARSGLGYLAQGASVFPRLTVRDNLVAVLSACGRPAAGAATLLEEAGLLEQAGQRAGTLSGGQRRRLEVARCLALEPRVVLLDEPFAGVDPGHVHALRERIRAMAGRGLGVLLTDHQVREALATCDRVYLLDGGSVQLSGTPEQVASSTVARDRYLGHDFCTG